jgi:Site-specific recombinase XerD
MTPRPRKSPYKELPDYLVYDKSKKQYRFTLINGVRKLMGANKSRAIAIAIEYNNRMRYKNILSSETLVMESGGDKGEYQPFSNHIDHLMERIFKEEKLSERVKQGLINDSIRAKEFFSTIASTDIDLEHVNLYLKQYHANGSAEVQNRKVMFLKKLFSYAVDESIMMDNPATRKKLKKLDGKKRKRLSLEDFIRIKNHAPLWLKTAMELSLQTAQARLEVSRIKYSIKSPSYGESGCIWLDTPNNGIYGTLYINRQKTKDKEAAHIAIPIGEQLKRIIDDSRDNVLSPYVVHRMPEKATKQNKSVDHFTQVDASYLSKAFSAIRDEIGIMRNLPIEYRPTFHEIRALSAHLFEQQGINPQARMAHSDEKSTKVYTKNHIEWVEVPHAQIVI